MIQFANDGNAHLVRDMWKTCFGDSDEFLDILFHYKYENRNTLIYFEGEKAVASLQMIPYTITFYGEEIPFAYLAGLCTLPEYRRKGYMAKLIHEAHRIIASRGIALSILIPAEEWLYGFYENYGYIQTFSKDDNAIPLKEILDTYPDEKDAYREFNRLYRALDFCVQKSETDFEAIKKDFILDGCPVKTNLSGMARIIDAWSLLKLYAARNPLKSFRIEVTGQDSGASLYLIEKGKAELILRSDKEPDMKVSEKLLCRLLFGYKLDKEGMPIQDYFENHYPIMNLMLE